LKTPVLETDRLILRPFVIDDAEDVFAWTGDPDVNKYMIYLQHKDVAFTRKCLTKFDHDSAIAYTFGFMRKEDMRLIGSGGVYYHADTADWHIGYNLRADAWNRGYATKAMRRIIAFAHQELGARDFISEHAVENEASGKVLEKCGLNFCGFGSFTKADGSRTFQSQRYSMHIE